MHVPILFPIATIMAALSFGAHADTLSPSHISSGRIAVYYGDLNIDTEHDAKIMMRIYSKATPR